MPAKRFASTRATSLKVSVTPPAAPATKGERTRAVLLDAAKRLFVANGYHGTSMRQIADEAGLALGGIYNHFGNKEDIFVAIMAERHPFLIVLPVMQAAQGDTVQRHPVRRLDGQRRRRGHQGLHDQHQRHDR